MILLSLIQRVAALVPQVASVVSGHLLLAEQSQTVETHLPREALLGSLVPVEVVVLLLVLLVRVELVVQPVVALVREVVVLELQVQEQLVEREP